MISATSVPQIELRPYQKAAHDALRQAFVQGHRRVIVHMPTGLGKTVTGLSFLFENGGRWIWLCHREELVAQAARTARSLNPEISIGIVQAERHEPHADLIIASVPSLIRPDRLAALGMLDGIVIDECHHAVSASYRQILDGLEARGSRRLPVIGLTATVERTDQIALNEVFERIVYQMPLLQAIQEGYLADIQTETVALNVDFDALPQSGDGDYQSAALSQALLEAGVADAVADAYVTKADGMKALTFAVSVEQARLTAESLTRRGVAAEWLSGETPSVQRRAMLGRLRSGETRVIANCGVLTEGFDEPSLEALILARPTQSKSLYVQMLGRGLRRYPGKDRCLVVDVAGVSRRHTLIQAASLFGLPIGSVESIVVATEAATTTPQAAAKVSAAQRLLDASQRAHLPLQRIHWVPVNPALFALSAGQAGTVLVLQRDHGWAVLITKRDADEVLTPAPVDFELATGMAEDYLRRAKAMGLARPDAEWRAQPASLRQMAALQKWRVAIPPGLTAGHATDLITTAVATAKARRWTA